MSTYRFFAENSAKLEAFLKELTNAGKYNCLFWICYPKGSGKIRSDLRRDNM